MTLDSGTRTRSRGREGFTLVETLVALAVLAFSLATLMGTQAVTAQKLAMANQMTTAALLVRHQMLIIEDELRDEGFSDTIDTDCGDFDEDAYSNYEWCVQIEPVEITDDAEDQFVANIHAELFGEGAGGEGSLSGSAAVSRFLPMIIGQVPRFINQVGERTRKITLRILWESPLGPQELTVTQFFVLDEPSTTGGLESTIPIQLQPGDLQNIPRILEGDE